MGNHVFSSWPYYIDGTISIVPVYLSMKVYLYLINGTITLLADNVLHYSRFIVNKGAPGLKCTKIENKIGLRMVQNGDIILNKVFVPEEDRLTGINSFQDINKVLDASTTCCPLLCRISEFHLVKSFKF